MKSLLPWFCLAAAASSPAVFAADGIDAWRNGNYLLAAQALSAKTDNDPVANYYLGMMRQYGYGLLKNNTLALRYFTQSAEKGYLPAQKLLASYYLIEVKNPELAFQWYKKAADANDTAAQMYCAAAYLFGYGVKPNSDTARKFYIEAAKSGNTIAQYTLGMNFLESRDNRNKAMGVIWLTKAAANGSAKAQVALANLYLNGNSVDQDLEKAKALIESAAKQNYQPAQASLGLLAYKEGDINRARELLTPVAEAENPFAQVALAQLYLDDKSPFYNTETGLSWMTKAAKQGSQEAQLALAKLYKDGKGVAANPALSKQWADAAKQSSKAKLKAEDPRIAIAKWLSDDKSEDLNQGAYELGGIYTAWHNKVALQENNYNQAPQMDMVTRKALYKPQFEMVKTQEVAINDYFDILAPSISSPKEEKWSYPQYSLTSETVAMLPPGTPLPGQDAQAASNDKSGKLSEAETKAKYQAVLNKLYNEAIVGNPSAQFDLGQLYQYGIGVAKNPQQAMIYFQLAAEQQDLRAEYNMGILYLQGQSEPVNYQKGIEWLMDAAFKGNPYAQYVLGNINETGLTDPKGVVVVPPNHEQAMSMYYLASANHFGLAEYRLADFFVKEKKAGLSVAARENRSKLIKRLYQGAANEGITEAVLPLAFYNAMDPDPAKQSMAFAEAKKQASSGNSMAALLLGMMYERGISVPADQVEAIYWYQQSAQNPVNQFILGTLYSQGTGLTKDVNKGRALLQQSADAGFSWANLNLAILKHQNGEPFVAELDKARQDGNSRAALLLADYYLLEAKDPENMRQARDIYQYLAEKGNKEGQLKLAFLWDRGLGGVANNALAAQWYTMAAEQGQPTAQYLLGQMYQLGKVGGQPDYAATKKWYTAAQSVYPQASVALGFVEETIDNDYANAAKEYSKAADSGDATAQYNLGLIYENGKGVEVDRQKAKSLYLQAAEQGYGKAMSQLAGLYFKGIGGIRDEQQSLYWYKKAAELNDNNALYQLGLFSETGVVIKLSYADALSYYQKAADMGNDKAKLALARMYQYGLGAPRDLDHAVSIYKDLAANNNAYAQYQLALVYLDGQQGERQPEQGKVLLGKASENGNLQARKMMQWMDAQQQQRVSYIEPVQTEQAMFHEDQSPDMIYMEALNQWNRGDENSSRMILDKLVKTYPDYSPAKKAFEQLNQQLQAEHKTVG